MSMHIAVRPLVCGLAALTVASVALAHPDDPKIRDTMPRYEGPGFRAGMGGVAGLVFDFDEVILRSWITVEEFGNHDWANDIWGYASESGREYAIIGLSDGTGFVEVTDPASPQIIAVKSGPHSTWRDMKTYQHHAYIVTEGTGQQAGIQVFDLSDIDSGVITPTSVVSTGPSTISTHNVAIDEVSGFLYRCGGGSNGLRIYDLANPAVPTYVSEWPDRYVHDAEIVTYTEGPYAGKQIAFCCGGFNGGWQQSGIDILDVTDKYDIELLARYQYPASRYSHQASLSEDRQYLLLNDEADESQLGITSRMHVIDVSDLQNPSEVDTFTNGSNSITHNLFVKDDLAYAANYRSGLRVFDVSNPTNASEVGYFDTYPGSDAASFNGLWGTYPFLPSGHILGSDREKGLFVWLFGGAQITFAYPEGRPALIDPAGDSFRVDVAVSEGGVEPGTARFFYDAGDGWQETELSPREGGGYDAVFGEVSCNASVQYYVQADTTSGLQWKDPPNAPGTTYATYAATDVLPGFFDDAEADNGWIANAFPGATGHWERGTPAGGGVAGDPPTDADGGGQCYATGLAAGVDVDNGFVQIYTPELEVTDEGAPFLAYDRWFYRNSPATSTDRLRVEVRDVDGTAWALVEEVTTPDLAWHHVEHELLPLVGDVDAVYVRLVAYDDYADHLVEVAIDNMAITYLGCAATNPADVNDDGAVNVDDLVAVISAWGPCPGGNPGCLGDIDNDGDVDVNDLVALIEAWE